MNPGNKEVMSSHVGDMRYLSAFAFSCANFVHNNHNRIKIRACNIAKEQLIRLSLLECILHLIQKMLLEF